MKYCTSIWNRVYKSLYYFFFYFNFIYYDFNLLCTFIFLLEFDFKLVISICFPSFLLLRFVEELNKSKIQRRFMAKGKDVRVTVILECTSCVRNEINGVSRGISRYITQKNRHNTPNRLELRKFCPHCYKYTIHGEIKK